jgi:hypothetical protein
VIADLELNLAFALAASPAAQPAGVVGRVAELLAAAWRDEVGHAVRSLGHADLNASYVLAPHLGSGEFISMVAPIALSAVAMPSEVPTPSPTSVRSPTAAPTRVFHTSDPATPIPTTVSRPDAASEYEQSNTIVLINGTNGTGAGVTTPGDSPIVIVGTICIVTENSTAILGDEAALAEFKSRFAQSFALSLSQRGVPLEADAVGVTNLREGSLLVDYSITLPIDFVVPLAAVRS